MTHSYKRPAEQWATGGKPMTGPQKGHLYYLGQENGVRIPFVDNRVCDNTQKVTKAEASLLISMFEHGVRPTDAHIDSLGRSMTPYDPPSHPSQWRDPFAPANAVQLDWLTELISRMSIPHEVTVQTLEGLTNGHASLLIERLKWYKDRCWMGYRDVKGMMVLLQGANDYALEELPYLDEEQEAVKHEEAVKLEDASTVSFSF